MTKILINRSTVEQALGLNSLLIESIDALRSALARQAEPVQEPVAWIHGDEFGDACHWVGGSMPPAGTKLYTAPPKRKPLTEGELEQAYRSIWSNIPRNFNHTSMGWIEQGIRYAEQAHGIGEKHE